MMYGEFPTSPVLFAASDSGYFVVHGQALALSAEKYGKDVHFHIVNPNQQALAMAALMSGVTKNKVTFTFNDFDFSGWHAEEMRAYYASLRFLVAPDILQTAGKLLILDIDCVVMNEFEFPEKPVAYFPREPLEGTFGWEKEGTRVAAGAVYYDSRAINVAHEVALAIRDLEMRWFVDQIGLSRAMQRVPEEHVHHFDASFMDWEFVENTVIWTGKGNRKYESEKYRNKKLAYDDEFEARIKWKPSVLLFPRLDLQFKKPTAPQIPNKNIPKIRTHWENFKNKFVRENPGTLVVQAPLWMFNEKVTEWTGVSRLIVPHMEKETFSRTANAVYYMQTVFPWLFTIDKNGWGGGASFVEKYSNSIEYSEKQFDDLVSYVKSGGTKFDDIQGKNYSPADSYIFVPLQLPHDQTIKYHSDISVEKFVESLCEWASKNKGDVPKIVFKGHPVNLGSMSVLKEIIAKYENVMYVEDLSIHSGIENACAVYVVNSGTGQEAMLYDKPVVVFGRCEYEGAVIKGNILELNTTWKTVLEDDFEERKKTYRRWYHWYISSVTYNSSL